MASRARIPSGELFPTEEPIPATELIGRREDVDELVQGLSAHGHRVIAAPRRTGKTSVCDAAIARLRDRGFYTVSLDLWETASQVELSSTLVARTLANRPAVKKILPSLVKGGQWLANSVEVTATTKLEVDLGQEVAVAWKPFLADRDPDAYLQFALELPNRIAEKDKKRIVIFLDEFQSIIDLEMRNHQEIQKRIRSVLQRSPKSSFLFAGSIEHMMKDIFSASQPLGTFGGFHHLSTITQADWASGIIARLDRDSTTIESDALELLITTGELHPRSTMLIAQRSHQAAVAEGVNMITTTLVKIGAVEARRQERSRHEAMVDKARAIGGKKTGALALRLLRRVAKDQGPYQGASSKDKPAIGRAMNALQQAGLVSDGEPGNSWIVVDPLFRLYLADLGNFAI
jgi:hypothetical protein